MILFTPMLNEYFLARLEQVFATNQPHRKMWWWRRRFICECVIQMVFDVDWIHVSPWMNYWMRMIIIIVVKIICASFFINLFWGRKLVRLYWPWCHEQHRLLVLWHGLLPLCFAMRLILWRSDSSGSGSVSPLLRAFEQARFWLFEQHFSGFLPACSAVTAAILRGRVNLMYESCVVPVSKMGRTHPGLRRG